MSEPQTSIPFTKNCAWCRRVTLGSSECDICDSCQAALDESKNGKRPSEHTSALATQVAGNHYKNLAIQPVEFCQKNKLTFCESSVVKYVCRHREKKGAEDIRKAIHFLELLLELEYPTEKK